MHTKMTYCSDCNLHELYRNDPPNVSFILAVNLHVLCYFVNDQLEWDYNTVITEQQPRPLLANFLMRYSLLCHFAQHVN